MGHRFLACFSPILLQGGTGSHHLETGPPLQQYGDILPYFEGRVWKGAQGAWENQKGCGDFDLNDSHHPSTTLHAFIDLAHRLAHRLARSVGGIAHKSSLCTPPVSPDILLRVS